MFLRISPTRGVIGFGTRGKVIPRFIGSFDIIERIGKVAYRLVLPPTLAVMHNVFHVSQLRKYVRDENHVIDHSELAVRADLSFEAQPVSIIDWREKVLKNKVIRPVRVS